MQNLHIVLSKYYLHKKEFLIEKVQIYLFFFSRLRQKTLRHFIFFPLFFPMLFSSLVFLFIFCSLVVLLTILHLGKGKSKTSKKKSSSRKSGKKSGRGRSSSGGRLSRGDAEDTKGCCCLCWALCCIFCCPPCPSSIVSKLAFHPPSSSSYTISGNDTSSKKGASGGSFKPKPSAGWPFSSSDLGNISAFTVKTPSGNKVACMFVPGEVLN